jgi:hypothetical protein
MNQMQTIETEVVGQRTLFDYSVLDAETRIVVQQRTGEIKSIAKRVAADVVEIGEKLADVKQRIRERGRFHEWLECELGWSERTAYNFIGVHQRFGSANFAIENVAVSALYALAAPSTPADAVETVKRLADGGERVTHTRAEEIIEEAKAKRPKQFELVETPADEATIDPQLPCWCKHKYIDHAEGTFCKKKNCGCNAFGGRTVPISEPGPAAKAAPVPESAKKPAIVETPFALDERSRAWLDLRIEFSVTFLPGAEGPETRQVLYKVRVGDEDFSVTETETAIGEDEVISWLTNPAIRCLDKSVAAYFAQPPETRAEKRERLHKAAVARWKGERAPSSNEEDDAGFHPGFPPGFDPKRAENGLAQSDEGNGEAGDYWAEWRASLSKEEREKYAGAPCSCGHAREMHDGDDDDGECTALNCGVNDPICKGYHCPDCDTKSGHQATCEHYVLGEGTPVQAKEAEDGGTPFPTEFDEVAMLRIASHCIGFDGLNKPVKICQVLGEPHIVVGITPEGSFDPKEVTAYPILPLGNVGEEEAAKLREGDDFYLGRKINCGSKKRPDWWVIVGPETIFRLKSEDKSQSNEFGVYVKGVEKIKIRFPKAAGKTAIIIHVVLDERNSLWRSSYSATGGSESFSGPIMESDPGYETRERALNVAGEKARDFLLRRLERGVSDNVRRQINAALPVLDKWMIANTVNHSAACPDDEIKADASVTPIPTEYPQEQINLMAEYCAAQAIPGEKSVKIYHVLDQPFVITGAVWQGKDCLQVDAMPILPLEQVGKENAKTYSQALAERRRGQRTDALSYEGIKINCGSKKNPQWWVMVGPTKIFTVDYSTAYPDNEIEVFPEDLDDDDVPYLEEPTLEDALEHALTSHIEGATCRWLTLQKNGATDDELLARIADEFAGQGGSSRNGGWKVKGGKKPEFTWERAEFGVKVLRGKRLLAKVREVLGIGAPSQCAASDQADDFTAPRCEECGRIDGAHSDTCSQNPNKLEFEDYLHYAEFTNPRGPRTTARKWMLSREIDGPVHAWKLYWEELEGKGITPSPYLCMCGHPLLSHKPGPGCSAKLSDQDCQCVMFVASAEPDEPKRARKGKRHKEIDTE